MGLKACQETEFEQPHILSTLAAGYAESGDFENAVKYSSKAVEVSARQPDTADIKEQLQKELDSYKQKKPTRELLTEEDEAKSKSKGKKPTADDGPSDTKKSDETAKPEDGNKKASDTEKPDEPKKSDDARKPDDAKKP